MSKTDTVIFARRELVRRQRAEELKSLMCSISSEFDPTSLRKKDRRQVRGQAPVIVVDTSVWVAARRHPRAP